MILYLDTRGPDNCVALYEDKQEAFIRTIPRHELSERLAVTVERMLEERGKGFGDLSGIIVRSGPGSFTGLRIGLSYANGLAYGLKIPLRGLPETESVDAVLQEPLKGSSLPVLPNYGAEPKTTQRKVRG